MPAILEAESTLTDRYQTTLPQAVRRALKLGKRDKIRYAIHPNGEVLLRRDTPSEDDDPALGSFLNFLTNDISKYPERLKAIDADTVQYLHSLTGNVELDLDSALSAEAE
jgi:antitoxin PrlF